MAKVPLPDRGQPLDVTYIYQLVDTINDLSTQVSSSTLSYTSVDTPSAGKQNIRTPQAKIVGGIVSVANNSTVNAGNEKTFTYNYGSGFKYPPIVTASIINSSTGTSAGKNVTLVLNPPTQEEVSGVVRFNESGEVTLSVHLIAVGIPN